MKPLYKRAKVLFNAHQKQYEVWYCNWFRWRFKSCYRFDENTSRPFHYRTKQRAEEMALEQAKAMLNSVEVWRG